jgi:GT2 family glycosyltransferase
MSVAVADVRISIVIPSWNGADLLEVVLPSLQRQTRRDFEVIVADNGSTDHTAEILRTRYPRVHHVLLEDNRGFAAAANAGIRAARGEIIVLLNNDVEAEPQWLAELCGALEANPDAGSCASRIMNYYERALIDSAGDRLGLIADQMGHGCRFEAPYEVPRPVLSACAAASAYRRTLFDSIGFFDERYISYYEDVDLGLRAQYAGFTCLYVPTAVVYHMVSATAQRIGDTKLALLLRNGLRVFYQYMPPAVLLVWGLPMLFFPLFHVWRVGAPSRIGAGAAAALILDLPAVIRQRRHVRRRRAISDRALLGMLMPPVMHFHRVMVQRASPCGRRISSALTLASLRLREVLLGLPGRTGFALADARAEVAQGTESRNNPPDHGSRVAAPWLDEGGGDEIIDVIIVNWNGRKWLDCCLAALRGSTVAVRITLVDNASTDGSAAYVRAAHRDVRLVEAGSNRGYAAGANLGLAQVTGRYAFVMNPDLLVAPEHLERLKGVLDSDPQVGAAQGRFYAIEPADFRIGVPQRGVLDSAGHVLARSRMVHDRGQGSPDHPAFDGAASIFSACGAGLFMRMSGMRDAAWNDEYFCEAFFAYKEDIDLCWRLRWLGWDIRYVPDALAYHVRSWAGNGLSWRTSSLAARRHSWKNHYLLMVRNDAAIHILRGLPWILAWEVVRLGHALLRDPRVFAAYGALLRALPDALRARRSLFARRRAGNAEMARWFGSGAVLLRATSVARRKVTA